MSDQKTYAKQIAREERDASRRLPEHMQPSAPAERMGRYDNEGRIIKVDTMTAVKACTRMLWKPPAGISGSANAGIVWVESVNNVMQTAVIRYDTCEGTRSRAYIARMQDLFARGEE